MRNGGVWRELGKWDGICARHQRHGLSALYSYDGPQTNSDGANPIRAGLIVLGHTVFGATTHWRDRREWVWVAKTPSAPEFTGTEQFPHIQGARTESGSSPLGPHDLRHDDCQSPVPRPNPREMSPLKPSLTPCQTGIKCSDLTVRICRLKR